jgi:hypothetical protein
MLMVDPNASWAVNMVNVSPTHEFDLFFEVSRFNAIEIGLFQSLHCQSISRPKLLTPPLPC